jgi:protein TonB
VSLPGTITIRLPDAPVVVPAGIPPVDSAVVIDTLTLLRSRIEQLNGLDALLGAAHNNSVNPESAVDERPEIISGFTPDYPDLLRQAGIEGTVVVEAVIDTLGHAEAASVRVMQSTNRAFDNSAREAVMRTVFRPGRIGGMVVRVLVQVPIAFAIRK